MIIGYYPNWDSGIVSAYFDRLRRDGQRKKAEARLRGDILTLLATWPRPIGVEIRLMRGYEPLWELKREVQGVAYRVFFCVKGDEIWLVDLIEKKRDKTPSRTLNAAYARMRGVMTGKVRRPLL